MVAITILFLVAGATAPLIGRLVDRYGARSVIPIGAVILGIGFILLSRMQNLWHLYGGYAIIGVGVASVGPVPASAIVLKWFLKRRGTAIGIMSSSVGAGGFAMSPIIGGYLIPSFGWRTSYLVLAVIVWVIIIPLALLVIRSKPADMGLYPHGVQASNVAAEAEVSASASRGSTLKMALATSVFWLIAASFLMFSASETGIVQNQVPYLSDIGLPLGAAATALGIVGLGSLIGKFSFGWLCDQIQAKYALGIGISLQLAALLVLMNTGPESPMAVIWLYALVLGLGAGSWLPTMSMLVSTNFGLASYGAIFGMTTLARSIGTAAGPVVAGYIYDTTGTYHWAFILFLALYLVAIATILAVRRPKLLQNFKGRGGG